MEPTKDLQNNSKPKPQTAIVKITILSVYIQPSRQKKSISQARTDQYRVLVFIPEVVTALKHVSKACIKPKGVKDTRL